MASKTRSNVGKRVGKVALSLISARGELSTKRFWGSIGMIVSLILICKGMDNATVRALLFTSAGLIGLGIADKIALGTNSQSYYTPTFGNDTNVGEN